MDFCASATGGLMDFCAIYGLFGDLLPDGAEWLAFGLAAFTLAFMVINVLVGVTAGYTWFERRAIARFQSRLGPNRWGPFGLLQPLADLIKLITKEDIVPDTADRPVFTLAPIVLLMPALVVVAVIPFGENSFLGRLNVGVLFIIGVTGINTFGIFMGGWGSRNKYAMLGAMRGVAMLISYEVPMALAIIGTVILASATLLAEGSALSALSLTGIVNGQDIPFLVVQPLGFLVFMIAASAEMSRAPFDMIEAESELGAGYHTEYSGIKFAIFQLAEFMAPIVTAVIATVLFLSGAREIGPIPGQVVFVVKVFALVFCMLWVRTTWPRLRVDQIMGFAWKGLFPLALVNMFLVAIEVWVVQAADSVALSPDGLWIMAAINWIATLVSIFAIANVLGQPKLKRATPVPSPLANMSVEAD